MLNNVNTAEEIGQFTSCDDVGSVEVLSSHSSTINDSTSTAQAGAQTIHLTNLCSPIQEHLTAVDPSHLLPDQRRAYDIINWHLMETLARRDPPQLLMIIPGEGGVGKSKTIQTITENFQSRGAGSCLVKSAYTGIASSLIDGKTLHVISCIPINGREPGAQTLKKMAAFWKDKLYLIIDEKSMVSRKFFAKLSQYIGRAKSLAGQGNNDKAFGAVNVILVGDFHQFPPVAAKKSAPLFVILTKGCSPLIPMNICEWRMLG